MMFVDSYLPPTTFSALRFLVKAMHRAHGDISHEAVADLARLCLSRDITVAHVCRACGVCGLPVTR